MSKLSEDQEKTPTVMHVSVGLIENVLPKLARGASRDSFGLNQKARILAAQKKKAK